MIIPRTQPQQSWARSSRLASQFFWRCSGIGQSADPCTTLIILSTSYIAPFPTCVLDCLRSCSLE